MVAGTLLLTGCATNRGGDSSDYTWKKHGPFAVRLNKNVTWTPGKPKGYDPKLPGYHLSGDVASFRMAPAGNERPETFILAITVPGRTKRLEMFRLSFSGISIECEPFKPGALTRITATNPKTHTTKTARTTASGTFFDFEVKGKEIQVIFKPAVLVHLQGECSVFWIDRYQQ